MITQYSSLVSLWNSHLNRKQLQYSTDIIILFTWRLLLSYKRHLPIGRLEVFLAKKWRTASSAKIDNKAEWRNMPNCWGQFSPEAHFSKMIHTGKKSISLSLDELSVLSVNFNEAAMGEGQQRVYTRSHTHVHSHTHDHTTVTADALLTVELGHAHTSPKHRHTYKHTLLWRHFQSHRGKTTHVESLQEKPK